MTKKTPVQLDREIAEALARAPRSSTAKIAIVWRRAASGLPGRDLWWNGSFFDDDLSARKIYASYEDAFEAWADAVDSLQESELVERVEV